MPRLFYDDVEENEFLKAEQERIAISDNEYDKVSLDRLLIELERLQSKKDRLRNLVNEDLERLICKIKDIENYIKLKSNT